MRILFVVSECVPFIKTGGLADVAGALPKALSKEDVDVRVLLPAYPAVQKALGKKAEKITLSLANQDPCTVLIGEAAGLNIIALDAPHYFDRPGNPYLQNGGRDFPDNAQRFALLSQVGAHIAEKGVGDWKPDIAHLHDWQAALTAPYIYVSGGNTPTLMTIHNMAFQQIVPRDMLAELRLPEHAFTPDKLEYYGQINVLKAGLVYATHITTVSPTYALELSDEQFGMGLEGLIAARRQDVTGILNGIDEEIWDPASDPTITSTYTSRAPKAKLKNKHALQGRLGLTPQADNPLMCVISRLTRQKGLDVLLAALPQFLNAGGQLAVLGTGDHDLEQGFQDLAARHQGQVGTVIGYDEALSHLFQAGSDAIIIPSRFEPCGLTQLYGLKYGTLPIVSRTGGLADTVIDANDAALSAGAATGFQFSPVTPDALAYTLHRAATLFQQSAVWRKMVQNAMTHKVGWTTSAARYKRLYEQILAG